MSADYWRVVEPVWNSISIYDGPDVFLKQFRAVRPEVGHLFAAHWCQSEVNNGGFLQFFENSTGVLAPEALEGFRAIGLDEWARLLEKAMAFFGEPYPRDQAVRKELLKAQPATNRKRRDRFSKLDDQFYQWQPPKENRFQLLANAYARSIPG